MNIVRMGIDLSKNSFHVHAVSEAGHSVLQRVEALQRVRRAAIARTGLWTLGFSAIAVAIALFVAWLVLPTPGEIAALRIERDELVSRIATLNQRGAQADVRRCGTEQLCIRVDLKAPRYGESSDYLVIKEH